MKLLTLAINLRYGADYDLGGFHREGLGVYIQNLIKALFCGGKVNNVYLFIHRKDRANARAYLEKCSLQDKASIIHSGNISDLVAKSLPRILLLGEKNLHALYNSSDRVPQPGQYLRELPKQLLDSICMTNRSIPTRLTFSARQGVVVPTSAAPILVVISILSVRDNHKQVILESAVSVTSDLREYGLSIELEAQSVLDSDQIFLRIFSSPPVGTLLISNIRLFACTPNTVIEPSIWQNVPFDTAASNSFVSVVNYHHPLTYQSSILRPSVYHIHDLVFLEHSELYSRFLDPHSLDTEIRRCLMLPSLISPGSTLVFSSYHAKRKHFEPYFPIQHDTCNAFIVRNCVLSELGASLKDSETDDSIIEIDKFIDSNPFYVMYPTQPRATKQFDMLFDIVDALRNEHPSLILVLTCHQEHLKSLWPSRNLDYVYFVPDLTRHALAHLYSRACLTIVTTKYEASLPWQFLESISCGTPAVCYRSEIVNEFIGLRYLSTDIADNCLFKTVREAYEKSVRFLAYNKVDRHNKGRDFARYCIESLRSTLPLASWKEVGDGYSEIIREAGSSDSSYLY